MFWMQKRFWLNIIFIVANAICFAQNGYYDNLSEALANKDSVVSLCIKKQKLTTFPMEILELRNLERLDISRNYISEIPQQINTLSKLHYLNAAQNYIKELPKEIAVLPLDTIILWDNMIRSFDSSFASLPLRYIDLRAIQMTRKEQKAIKNLFPKARIRKDHPCNCGSRKE